MKKRIAIVGLGLIGGSLGLGLRKRLEQDSDRLAPEWFVTGYDSDPAVTARALEIGAIDLSLGSLEELSNPPPHIVVLAVPTSCVALVAQKVMRLVPASTLVTDCGSVKQAIVRKLERKPASAARFVGGHPMAGAETAGIDAARADLFSGARWAITPHSGVDRIAEDRAALKPLLQMVEAAGAKPVFLGAGAHDSAVAHISHLSYVLSVAFSLACAAEAQNNEAVALLASRSFGDLTRIARANPEGPLDYCVLNRAHLLRAIEVFMARASEMRAALENRDDEQLLSLATRARDFVISVDKYHF